MTKERTKHRGRLIATSDTGMTALRVTEGEIWKTMQSKIPSLVGSSLTFSSSSSVIRGFTMAQRAFSHSETLFSIKFFVQVKHQAANALLFRLQQARGACLTCVIIIVSTIRILIISWKERGTLCQRWRCSFFKKM